MVIQHTQSQANGRTNASRQAVSGKKTDILKISFYGIQSLHTWRKMRPNLGNYILLGNDVGRNYSVRKSPPHSVTKHQNTICTIANNAIYGKEKKKKKKKNRVRSGIRTHALRRGPEHSTHSVGKGDLESGALDRSAILTAARSGTFEAS